MKRSDGEKNILLQYFTNLDKPVFAFKNLSPQVAAALVARFSRAKDDIRSVFLREFAGYVRPVDISGEMEKAGEGFLDRVLIGFGDDSVGQCGGVHFACEGISNIAVKALEDARIGAAAIERSSRYVEFDQQDEFGRWQYVVPSGLGTGNEALFRVAANSLFETYSELLPKVKEHLYSKYPIHSIPLKNPDTGMPMEFREDKEIPQWALSAYKSTINSKACDLLRGLLPMATRTSAGFFFTGQAIEHTLTKMLSSKVREIITLGIDVRHEIEQVAPMFIKRSSVSEHLFPSSEISKFVKIYTRNSIKPHEKGVRLVSCTNYPYQKIAATIIYPYVKSDILRLENACESVSIIDHLDLFEAYVKNRTNRREKPGRALEAIDLTFSITMNIGAWRDLQRHRLCTQDHKPFSMDLGYEVPIELDEVEYDGQSAYNKIISVVEDTTKVYGEIRKSAPEAAEYIVPFASFVNFYIKLNLRELVHVCELRSIPQGHDDYRTVVQEMWRLATEAYPLLKIFGKFVDFNSYDLGRLQQETKNATRNQLEG